MKNPLLTLVIVLTFYNPGTLPVWADQIKNVRTTVTPDDRIMIEYDLEAGNLCTISLDVSLDGGSSFPLKPLSLDRDIGDGIEPGRGKRILWDVFTDVKKLNGDLAVKISASPDLKRPSHNLPQEMGCESGISMVFIPGGTFRMGSDWERDPANPDRDKRMFLRELPVHTVTVSSFRMSACEITQGEYEEVMGANPSNFRGSGLPVESVNWWQAIQFCNRLSERSGLTKCYNEVTGDCDLSKNGFRLPTEAEWEYACRAGTNTNYYSGNNENDLDRTGWYYGNSGERNLVAAKWEIDAVKNNTCSTHPVGQKIPNALGLFDMHGNVWEWCNDWYGNYTSGNSMDPAGIHHGVTRVGRGGGWYYFAGGCRSSFRMGFSPYNRSADVGFRIVRR